MATDIGLLWQTKVPSLSETADIQEALRLYHYGAPSGTGPGEYDVTSSDTADLEAIGIGVAYHLQTLDDRLSTAETTLLDTLKETTFSAKGDLLSASSDNTLEILNLGTTGQVLTVNTSTDSGLEWQTPEVQLNNAAVLTNKSFNLTNNTLSGTLAEFNLALSDNDFASLSGIETLTNKSIQLVTTTSTTDGSIFWDTTNKKIKVGNGTTSLDFASSTLFPKETTAASYTLILTDKDKLIETNNASANTLIVPTESVAFPVGSVVNILQTGAGQTTLDGAVVTTGTYFSGGASAATTVLINTYNTNFVAGLVLSGTGIVADTRLSSIAPGAVTTGTYHSGGASAATSVVIKENRAEMQTNQLITGTNIDTDTLTTTFTDLSLQTATYHSGGASAATTVVIKQRTLDILVGSTRELPVVGQKISGTGLASNQRITAIAETSITTQAWGSGGASGQNTMVMSAANANITIGQRVAGTGITGNVYVQNFVGTTLTLTANLTAQASGTYTFYGSTLTFSPASTAQIAGSITFIGTTVNMSKPTLGQLSGTITFNGTTLTFSPAASSQISGTISGKVIINATPGYKTRTRWSGVALVKRGTNIWSAFGDLGV